MSSMRLIINNIDVEFSAIYIGNMFWKHNIAQVSSITLLPIIGNGQLAIIEIRHWCDSEVAYNFIRRLRMPEGEARIVHTDDQWWPVQATTLENAHHRNNPYYTTWFPGVYFEPDTSDEDAATTRMFEAAFTDKEYDWMCCAV